MRIGEPEKYAITYHRKDGGSTHIVHHGTMRTCQDMVRQIIEVQNREPDERTHIVRYSVIPVKPMP